MMTNTPCPRCGSNEIIQNAEVRDYDENSYRTLSVYVPLRTPQGGLFKRTSESSEVRASVCGGCGYTELYAVNYEALLKASK